MSVGIEGGGTRAPGVTVLPLMITLLVSDEESGGGSVEFVAPEIKPKDSGVSDGKELAGALADNARCPGYVCRETRCC